MLKEKLVAWVKWATHSVEDEAKALQQALAWLMAVALLIGSIIFIFFELQFNSDVWSAYLNANLAKTLTGVIVFFTVFVWFELATSGRTLKHITTCDPEMFKENLWLMVAARAVAAFFILGIMYLITRLILGQ
jgi:hypothetical protein